MADTHSLTHGCPQESLLRALKKVCVQMKHLTLVHSSVATPSTATSLPGPTPSTITTSLLAQCRKKQNHTYRVVAIETLGGVASALEVDVFSEFSVIASPILLPAGEGEEEEEKEEEGEERREGATQRMLLREKTAEALGKTWPSDPNTQGRLVDDWSHGYLSSRCVCVCVCVCVCAAASFSGALYTISSALPLYTWRVQLALAGALKSLFTQYAPPPSPPLPPVADTVYIYIYDHRLSVEAMSDPDMTVISTKTIPSLLKCSSQ